MNKYEPIFVTKPFLPPLDEYVVSLKEIWKSCQLTNNGPFHEKLESKLASYLGVKYISLFANGTLALMAALQVSGIKGDVITTPFSFVATTHALYWNGLNPVFCDIENEYMNLDPKSIEKAITPKTKAILPVHVYGNPCNVKAIKKIADKHNLKLIYDACHAFDVKINNQPVLNYGDLSVLSFHATKVFTTFEGGAIISHDKRTKNKIDLIRNFGFAGETSVVMPGINSKMNETEAAFGLLQLKYVKQAINKRKNITNYYRDKLSLIPGISCLQDISQVKHNYAYFPIRIDKEEYGISRDEVYGVMKENNIHCRRYFYPLISKFYPYNKLPTSKTRNLPIAEKVSKEILCLPIYPDLKRNIQDIILNILCKRRK